MKTVKLVFGILCIVLCVLVMLQSCIAGLGNALAENGEVSGTAGLLVSIGLLVGGIVMVATRKSEGKGGSIAGIIIFGLAALLGFANAGSYGDLKVWSALCVLMVVINLIAAIKTKKAG